MVTQNYSVSSNFVQIFDLNLLIFGICRNVGNCFCQFTQLLLFLTKNMYSPPFMVPVPRKKHAYQTKRLQTQADLTTACPYYCHYVVGMQFSNWWIISFRMIIHSIRTHRHSSSAESVSLMAYHISQMHIWRQVG